MTRDVSARSVSDEANSFCIALKYKVTQGCEPLEFALMAQGMSTAIDIIKVDGLLCDN